MNLPIDLALSREQVVRGGIKGLPESFIHEATEASSYIWPFCLEASALIQTCLVPWFWLDR